MNPGRILEVNIALLWLQKLLKNGGKKLEDQIGLEYYNKDNQEFEMKIWLSLEKRFLGMNDS